LENIIIPDTKKTSDKAGAGIKGGVEGKTPPLPYVNGKVDVNAHMEEEYDKAATYVDPIIHNQIIVENQSLPYNWMLDIEPIITINMVDTQSK